MRCVQKAILCANLKTVILKPLAISWFIENFIEVLTCFTFCETNQYKFLLKCLRSAPKLIKLAKIQCFNFWYFCIFHHRCQTLLQKVINLSIKPIFATKPNFFLSTPHEGNIDKTADYHRQIFRLFIFVKKVSRNMEACFSANGIEVEVPSVLYSIPNPGLTNID